MFINGGGGGGAMEKQIIIETRAACSCVPAYNFSQTAAF